MPGAAPAYVPIGAEATDPKSPYKIQLVSPPKLSGVTTISTKVSPGAHSTV